MAESKGLVNVMTPGEVTDQRALKNQARAGTDVIKAADDITFENDLAGHIRKRWYEARRSKFIVEEQMLKNLRQIDGTYEPDMLTAIQEADVPNYFMMLTDTKCRAAEAWIKDVVCQPSYKPWDIEPTPVPNLPPETEQAIREHFISQMFEVIVQFIVEQQGQVRPMEIMGLIRTMMPKFEKQMREEVIKEAKERTAEIKIKVDDHLTEGGWYDAIENFIKDIVYLKAGFIKGPVMRLEPTIHITTGEDGKHKIEVKDEFVWKYERRSPFHIYPQPNSTGPQDGYLIDLVRIKKKELMRLREMPGYSKERIDEVLEIWKNGGLREWTLFDAPKQMIEKKTTMDLYLGENIDGLEFWGDMQGQLLLDWGMSEKDIPDPLAEYPITAWLIERHVIGAKLNYDPMKQRPYYRVCYEEIQDNIWGKGLPELIVDIQRACNASVRAIMHNLAVAAGPQVEVNKDRLAPGESTKVWPYRVWLTTNDQIETSKAINFYAPPIVVERLIACYKFFSNLADEFCGVPAYAHGDPQIGGAGNTASGFSMLITQAARGIKGLVKAIDSRVICPSVKQAYYKVIEQIKNYGILPDHKIVPQGAISLLVKEQQAMRQIEFMQMTNNPTDVSIMGPDGRKYVLETTSRNVGFDPTKAVPEHQMSPALPGMGQAIPSQTAPQTLDQAGNPSQGQGFRTFNQGGPAGINPQPAP